MMEEKIVQEDASSSLARATPTRKTTVSLPSSPVALFKTCGSKKSDKKKKKRKEKTKSRKENVPMEHRKQKEKESGKAKSKKHSSMVITAPPEVTEYFDDIFQTAFEAYPNEKQMTGAIKRVEVHFYLKTKTGKLTEKEKHDVVHKEPVARSDKDRKTSKNQEHKKKKKKTKKKEKMHRNANSTKDESPCEDANKVGEFQSNFEDHSTATTTSFPFDSVNKLIGKSVAFAKRSDPIPIDITISQVGQGIYSTFGPRVRKGEFEPTNSPLVVVPAGELSASPKSPRVPIDLNDEEMSILAPTRQTFKSIDDLDNGTISECSDYEPVHTKKFNWILQKKFGRPWYMRSFSAEDNVSLLADYDCHKEFEAMNACSSKETTVDLLAKSPTMQAMIGRMVDGHCHDPDESHDFRMNNNVIALQKRAESTTQNSSFLAADGEELNPDQTAEVKSNHSAASNQHNQSTLKQEGYTLEHLLSSSRKQEEPETTFEI